MQSIISTPAARSRQGSIPGKLQVFDKSEVFFLSPFSRWVDQEDFLQKVSFHVEPNRNVLSFNTVLSKDLRWCSEVTGQDKVIDRLD